MAAINRATIRETIRQLGDFKNVRRFPNADIDKEIQRKFDRFWAIVDEAHEGWWDTEGNVVTVASQAYIALPADAKAVKGVDRIDGGEPFEMVQVGLHQRNRYGTTTAKPVAYRLSSRGLELYPTPNAVYSLRVVYTPKPATLDESTPREWFEGWEDFIIQGVIYELKSSQGLPEAGLFKGKMDDAEKALRASTSARRQAEPEYLRLREYDGMDPYDDGIY